MTSKHPPSACSFLGVLGIRHAAACAGRLGCGCCFSQDQGLPSRSSHLRASAFGPGGAQPSPLSSSSLQEVTSQPVMGFDPLPPLDSIISYTRPERYFPAPVQAQLASSQHRHLAASAGVHVGAQHWHLLPARESSLAWALASRLSEQARLVLLPLRGAAGGHRRQQLVTAAEAKPGGK